MPEISQLGYGSLGLALSLIGNTFGWARALGPGPTSHTPHNAGLPRCVTPLVDRIPMLIRTIRFGTLSD